MTAPILHRQWRPLTEAERAEYAALTANRTPPPALRDGTPHQPGLAWAARIIVAAALAALFWSN